jgi:nuclear pore complex protein Nup214
MHLPWPGLGVDLTSTRVEVWGPDPEAPPLPPAPLLAVATSDGALRLFTFSHRERPTQGIVAPALPLRHTPPILAQPAVQVGLQIWWGRRMCCWQHT